MNAHSRSRSRRRLNAVNTYLLPNVRSKIGQSLSRSKTDGIKNPTEQLLVFSSVVKGFERGLGKGLILPDKAGCCFGCLIPAGVRSDVPDQFARVRVVYLKGISRTCGQWDDCVLCVDDG